MKAFKHYRPDSVDDAAAVLNEFQGRAKLMAGGTDLLGTLKDRVHPEYVEAVIDIKNIPGLTGLRERPDGLTIGAATPLVDIAEDLGVQANYPILAQAAQSVASPQIRNMATIGGNICQEPRCWYYRHPDNTFHCLRKDGKLCNALTGENRYHSIFGAARVGDPPCTSACPTDTDIPNYMEKLRAGDVSGAAAVLYQVNPMPAVTGRVCPHFCQSDCNRRTAWTNPFRSGTSNASWETISTNILRNSRPRLQVPPAGKPPWWDPDRLAFPRPITFVGPAMRLWSSTAFRKPEEC